MATARDISFLVFIVCGFSLLIFWLLKYGMSYLYEFYLGETAVEIRLFRSFTIFSIRYKDIADVWEVRFLGGFPDKEAGLTRLMFTLSLGNRMTTRAVLIKRRNSIWEYVVISPRHPSLFIAEIRSKMTATPASPTTRRHSP
ncbi:MAG: hypothetical protein EOR72_13820 [Mesorhizobium sp.]|uniref:hypothetical protein n=1 Tax=Mesorhizobium sp. TaxID=1871066 RepID=UPI000FE4665D|nr:hypothetical protein [Mesorhizobium sp.]RWM14954.1 MAG: hypothetical protein EOR72_13820 [Mesorhizobium sp.]